MMTSPIKRQLYQNIENPPQIQIANLYDSCVGEFAFEFACALRVRSCVRWRVRCVCVACACACACVCEFVFLQHLTFTGESRVLGNYHPVKIWRKNFAKFFHSTLL